MNKSMNKSMNKTVDLDIDNYDLQDILNLFTGQIRVQTKNGRITLTCQKHPEIPRSEDETLGIRKFVYTSFSQFDKEISDGTLVKFENTIDFMLDPTISDPIMTSRMEKLMAYILGGIAGKLGNRYEARWLAEKYIDLLNTNQFFK